MKYLYSVLIIILLCLISFISGYFYHKPEQIIEEVEVIKNVDHIVYRDYEHTNNDVCIDLLKKYDQTPFNQTFTVNELNPEYTDLTLKWDLYERNGEQEIKVPVYQSGNWKFYTGLGIGVAAVGGLVYLLH